MTVYILMVLVWSGNPFYGYDTIPTVEFQTKQACEATIEKVKATGGKGSNFKGYCLEVQK